MKSQCYFLATCLWIIIVMLILAPMSIAAASAANCDACARLEGTTLRWIIPYPPGGGYDIISRLIGPYLEEELGVEVHFDYVTGGAGMVAAKNLHAASTGGLTLALLNGNSFLMDTILYGETEALHPLKDLTPLCRISLDRHILLSNPNSPFKTVEDLIRIGRTRPIVFGSQSIRGQISFMAAMLHKVLGIQYLIIPNYKGTKKLALALLQNEIDIMVTSDFRYAESGDLLPLLRISEQPYPGAEWYNKLPHVDGKNGLAVHLARVKGEDAEKAEIEAEAITILTSMTRVIFGPPGMKKELAECVEESLTRSLNNPVFRTQAQKAQRVLDVAGSKEVTISFMFLEEVVKKYADYLNREIEILK